MFWWRKQQYTKLVEDAIAHPSGQSHQKIQRWFRQWMGQDQSYLPLRTRRRRIHYVLKALRTLPDRAERRALGHTPLGFDDLVVEAFLSDTNTGSIYLFGASDNLGYFELYRKYIRLGSTAVDIGANVGMHSLVMSRCVGAKGKVVGFEPSPAIYKRFTHNLQINHITNVEALPAAASSKEGELHFMDVSDEANIGKSHVASDGDICVAARRLDDALPADAQVSLIKIDVEGHEIDALLGAQETLKRCKPVLFVECNADQYSVHDLLATIPYDYDLFTVGNRLADPIKPIPQASIDSLLAGKTSDILVLPK